MLPLIVREMNADRPVNVLALVDEAWSEALATTAERDDADSDMLYVPASELSLRGLRRISGCVRVRVRVVRAQHVSGGVSATVAIAVR
jgi:hypothetical protein